MSFNPPADKNSLRAQCLCARKAISAAAAQHAAQLMSDYLLSTLTGSGKTIAGYVAMRGEIDVSYALSKYEKNGATLCLPVAESADRPLVFRRWRFGQALEKGRHNVAVPPASEPLLIPDVVLVPLVAFDKAGNRLGYGAGYYDRTIGRLRSLQKSVQVIGVAYSVQRVEHIPAEAHDAKLDAVVTETGIVRIA